MYMNLYPESCSLSALKRSVTRRSLYPRNMKFPDIHLTETTYYAISYLFGYLPPQPFSTARPFPSQKPISQCSNPRYRNPFQLPLSPRSRPLDSSAYIQVLKPCLVTHTAFSCSPVPESVHHPRMGHHPLETCTAEG